MTSQSYIDHSYIAPNETIIVGLSGGPDSVFLLHQLIALQQKIPFTIVAAHLNHEWRATAEQDELFCKDLCALLQVTYVSKKISELSAQPYKNRSQEAQGRYYRKLFLESVQQQHGAHKIFLAHHHDDQLETFFIKLIRGTSCDGLNGLKTINNQYYRPLLHVTKETILSYLDTHKIAYVHDETNNDLTFLRNAIRHKLIPVLHEIDNRSCPNIMRAIQSIQETNSFVDAHVHGAYESVVQNNVLDLALFHTQELFLQKKVLLQWLYTNKCAFTPSTAFIHEILRFFKSPEGGIHQLTESWKLEKKQNKIKIINT